MSNITNVPEIINNYNVYNNGNVLIGVSGAVTLPTFDAITEEVSGAGILGSYETSVPGSYSSMTQEVPFRILDEGNLLSDGSVVYGRSDIQSICPEHGKSNRCIGL